MSDTNIVESILEAMEIVSTKNVNKIMFDKTIECEIIDNSDSKNGHYRVSDGSSKFDAYSEKTSYAKGSKVLVKIPQGDFSGKKYIESLVEKEGGESITYLSALNTIMDIVELTKKEPVKYLDSEDKFSLIANGEEKKKLIWSFDFTDPKNQNIWLDNIYSSFYVEADFKTALNNVKKGTYGLYFEVTIRLANGNLLTQYYNLNSTEFFGNPYKFSIYTNQSKKFNIKNLRRFETIELYFSQGGDFKNIDGTDYSNSSKTPDLFVKNIRVGLGSDLVDIPDNNLKLITLDSLEFGTTETTYTIPVGLDYFWFNKSEENKYLGFSDGVAEVRLTGQQINEYNELNNKCGTKINNNIINMREYDEIEYLKLVADETRLKNQKNLNMPPDEQSLKLMADIQDVHNILIGIKLLLDKDYKNLLTTFKNNMPQEFSTDENIDINSYNLDTSLLDKYLNKPLKNTDNSINTQASFLEFYKNVFKYIAAVYTSLKNNLPDETKEIERKIPKDWIKMDDLTDYGMDELDDYGMIDLRKTFLDDYMGKIEIILGDKEVSVNGGLFEDKLKIKYSNYIKYYNNFKTEVKKIKTLLNNYYKKIEEKLPDFKLLNFSWSVEEDEKNKTEFKPLYTFTINGKTYNNDYYLTKDGKLNVTEWTESSYNIFDNLYCIYWYRFENDYEDLDDPFGEKGWKRISSENLFTEYKKDINSQDYVFIGTNASTSPIINLGLLNKTNDEWIDNKKYWSIEDSAENKASLSIVLNPQNIEEKFKVILIYNHEQFESNELIFNNINHPNNQNVITDGVLNIVHHQNSQDHYPFYNGSSKQLLNSNDAYTERQIRAEYELSEEETLNGYIYWYFPSNKTQLEFSNNLDGFIKKEAYKLANKAATYQYNEEKSEFNLIKKDDNANIVYEENYEKVYEISSEKEKDGYYEIDKEKNIWIKKYDLKQTYLPGEDGYVCFSKRLSGIKKENLNEALAFPYRIKNSYDINNSKNLIKCQLILDNGTKKEGNKGFSFSLFGSNGTDYTLVVRPANIMKTTVKDEEALVLKAEVYGKSGEIFSDAQFDVEWVNPNGHEEFGVTSYSCKNDGNSFEIEVNDLTKSRYGILKIIATIKDNGAEINLDTLYAIPWSADGAFYQLSGPTGVTYNSHGTLMNYDKTAYSLFENGNIKDATIKIIYRDSDLKSDYKKDDNEVDMSSWLPKLGNEDQARILFPPPLYIEDIGIYPYIQATVEDEKGEVEIKFIQPLTIEQDRFESTFLNKWDGSLWIDKDNNTIMSAMVGAGKKDDNNTFSGVLMGQVEGKTGIAESGIGLYGFHQGGQSFGFNIDGTAFLGKSGQGRIEFNGNRGLIKSALWEKSFYKDNGELKDPSNPPYDINGNIGKGNSGMCIDLQNGRIDAHNFKLTGENLLLQSSPEKDENYLFLGDLENSYLQLTKSGKLTIKVNTFELTSSENSSPDDPPPLGTNFSAAILNKISDSSDGIYLEGGRLLINAFGIRTGVLTSQQKTNGIPNMTINMDTGHIDAYNFKLTAGGNSLYLNSNPSNSTDHYFKIEHENNHLQFTKDGALQINIEGDNSYFKAKNFNLDVDSDIDLILNINTDYWANATDNSGKPYSLIEYKFEADICSKIGVGLIDYTNCNDISGGLSQVVIKNWKTFLKKIEDSNNNPMLHTKEIWKSIHKKDLPTTGVLTTEDEITKTGWDIITSTVYNIKNWENNEVDQSDARIILRLAEELSDLSAKYLKIKFDKTGLLIYRYFINTDETKNIRDIFEVNTTGVSAFMNNISLSNEICGEDLPPSEETKEGTLFFLLEETEQ